MCACWHHIIAVFLRGDKQAAAQHHRKLSNSAYMHIGGLGRLISFHPPRLTILLVDPFRTAVPFMGQTSQIPSTLSPKRDCSLERVNQENSRNVRALLQACVRYGTYLCDDDDVITFADFLETLSVVTTHVVYSKNASRREKPNKYEIVRTAIPYQAARETVLTSCGIPSRITCNQIIPGACPWYDLYTRKKKRKRKTITRRVNRRQEEKNEGKKKTNEGKTKQTCAQRARRQTSSEDKVAVCWYDQSCDLSPLMGQRKDVTRRPDGRLEGNKRVRSDKELTTNKTREVLCNGWWAKDDTTDPKRTETDVPRGGQK